MEAAGKLRTAQTGKVTVKLIPQARDAVNRITARLGLSQTDVINRAVLAYDFLEEESAAGADVLIRRKDGTVSSVKFL